jgi:general secretion pathway protein G
MQTPSRLRRRSGGFTLIEVLLVLAILVIIAGFAVTAIRPAQRRAKINAAKAQIEAFKTPLEMYNMSIGDFPSSAQGLEALRYSPTDLTDPNMWDGPYLDKDVPLDPWLNPYQYEWPPRNQEDFPDIWSWGPDGQDGTDDDVVNWLQIQR